MSNVKQMTEDEVRNSASHKLKFDVPENGVKQGTGQITTFRQLGFNCENNNHKPDGWYFPDDTNAVAIIFETKAESRNLSDQECVNELIANIEITKTKYKRVAGILYNGKEQRVFINTDELKEIPDEI